MIKKILNIIIYLLNYDYAIEHLKCANSMSCSYKIQSCVQQRFISVFFLSYFKIFLSIITQTMLAN